VNIKKRIMKRTWFGILGAFLLLFGLGVGLAPAAALAQSPGPLDHVVVNPAATTLAVGATQQFSAQGYDASNVAIPGLTYYWGAAVGAGSITTSGLFTAANAVGTYTNGIQAVALQGGIVKVGYATVVVTSAAQGPLDHVTITPASTTLAMGGTQQFSAQGYDASNVAIPGLTYYWGVAAVGAGTVTQTGLFTAGSIAGSYADAVQVIAVQDSIAVEVAYASVTVTGVSTSLDHVTITPGSTTLAMGGTQQFSAQGYDASNVAIPGLTYYWSVVVAGPGTITQAGLFTAGSIAGSYADAVQAIAVQGNAIVKYATASVTVTSVTTGALDHVAITPASATLAMGGAQQFSAQGYDASNVAIPGLTYYWSVVVAGAGTITQAGLFTAGNTPGPYPNAVQAIAVQGNIIKFRGASVTVSGVTPGVLDHVRVTPSSANVAAGGTRQFTAQGYDASNVAIPGLTYYWSVVVAGAGTITQAGLFTAGNTPGPYPNAIQAIAVQGGNIKYATASVTVTSTPTPTPTPTLTDAKRALVLVGASLRSLGFDNFLGAQWTVTENGATSIIRAIPGVVKAISSTSLTLLPNGQTQTVNFALTSDTVVIATNALKVDEKAVVVTTDDQVSLVLEVPISSTGWRTSLGTNIPCIVQQAPPGIKKDMQKYLDKFGDRFLPAGWDKGKKTGWDKNDHGEHED
jgi:hypothetical protein